MPHATTRSVNGLGDARPRTAELLAVVGWPVAHSRSPVMMGAALHALGLPWRYVRLPVPPGRFAETVRALPASGYRGINVTIPHKLAALGLADSATTAAAAIGAANTLTFDEERGIEADNTDAGGFLDALAEPPAGRRAMVLGAGGAGRAVVWALRESGAAEVSVWNRNADRARALAREMGVRQVERPEPAELLVNATAVGLDGTDGGESAILAALRLSGLRPPGVVVDMVYGGESGALLAWARRGGARTVDGLEVLAAQGARSLERWTGRPAPLEAMLEAVRGT